MGAVPPQNFYYFSVWEDEAAKGSPVGTRRSPNLETHCYWAVEGPPQIAWSECGVAVVCCWCVVSFNGWRGKMVHSCRNERICPRPRGTKTPQSTYVGTWTNGWTGVWKKTLFSPVLWLINLSVGPKLKTCVCTYGASLQLRTHDQHTRERNFDQPIFTQALTKKKIWLKILFLSTVFQVPKVHSTNVEQLPADHWILKFNHSW